MARGESILPCQLVDVEFRWTGLENSNCAGTVWVADATPHVGIYVLQTRKRIRDDHGNVEWTEWANVPVVSE